MSSIDRDQVVAAMKEQYAALGSLMHSLTPQQWQQQSILPGWRVHDVFTHCLGTEYMLLGIDPPATDGEFGDHVRNPIAERNEQWVLALRDETPEQMLARWEEATAKRTALLDGQSQEDFDAESWTPVGQGTWGRFMRIRVFDLWLHELDIRDSLGDAGHEEGPAAELALTEVEQSLGYIIGRRSGAPDGSRVLIELTGPVERYYAVVIDGKAKVVESVEDPTVMLRMSSTDWARLTGGRGDADQIAQRVEVGGDIELGKRMARNLQFTM